MLLAHKDFLLVLEIWNCWIALSVSAGKGLNFFTNDVFLLLQYDGIKLQLIGFSYDKKSANVVMWKDKECEYISRA